MTLFGRPHRGIERVFLHCSASDDVSLAGGELVETVRNWHRARGFSDVGYHILIDKHGEVLPGRDIEKTPAAQKGHNTGTVAICVHGLEDFADASMAACKALCEEINEACDGRVTFHGHCEVSAKTCPVFDYKALLILDRFGRMP